MIKMIKTLARCVREYKKPALLTPLFVVLEVIMDVVVPLLMAMIIDYGIDAGHIPSIGKYGALLLGAALLALVFGVQSGRTAAAASAGFAKNVRHDLYHHLQEFSFENIDKFSTSSLVTRLTTDVTNVQNAFQMITRIAVRAPIMLLFSLIMAFGINPRLSMVFLGVLPVLGIGIYIIMSRVHPTFEKVFKMYDKLNNVVQENLRGIRVVKNYVREDHEIEKFQGVSGEIFTTFSRAEKMMAFTMPLMQSSMYVCTLLLSWLGAQMIVSATMTTGQLMSLLSYAMQILMSLMMLSMVFVMLTISRASAERIVEVLDEKSTLVGGENPAGSVPDGSILFENVSFSYAGEGGKLALKDVSLDIKSGQTVGIIGGTGAAKSTLVQLIPRLYDATAGSLKVGGRDVRDYDLEALRRSVSMVLQKNELFSGTIKENLRWGDKNATDEQLVHACQLAQADGFIQEMPDKYDTVIEQGGTNVSGGQKQRLCIARALLAKPKVLILDDSTSAVDTRTDALIRKAFAEEIPHTTKIIIAQRIASVEHADQIIVMDGGIINAVGTHQDLLETNEIYREVYESQQKGGLSDGAA